MPLINRRIVLAAHPDGAVTAKDFAIEDAVCPKLLRGMFRVRNIWFSVDPMIRIFIDGKPLGGALQPIDPGTVIPGPAVGEVIESRHDEFPEGSLVEGRLGWQTFATSDGSGVRLLDPATGPPHWALGPLGLPGFTAWCGLRVAGGVGPTDTVLVSGAGGAVGSVVGSLVREAGGRAVGIAKGVERCHWLVDEGGYDAAVDRGAPDFLSQLDVELPQGASVYFDNVGGALFAQVAGRMQRKGRIVISGLMSQYQGTIDNGPDRLPSLLNAIMARGLRVEAFSNTEFLAQRPAFEAELGELLHAGRMRADFKIFEGIESASEAFAGLFRNSARGKVLVKL